MVVNLKQDYKFPLKTNEDLEDTEKILKNDENYENLVIIFRIPTDARVHICQETSASNFAGSGAAAGAGAARFV